MSIDSRFSSLHRKREPEWQSVNYTDINNRMWKAIIFNNILVKCTLWKYFYFVTLIYFVLCYCKWCHRKEIKIIFIQNYYNNSVESFFFFTKYWNRKVCGKIIHFAETVLNKNKNSQLYVPNFTPHRYIMQFHSKEAFKIYLKLFPTNS